MDFELRPYYSYLLLNSYRHFKANPEAKNVSKLDFDFFCRTNNRTIFEYFLTFQIGRAHV